MQKIIEIKDGVARLPLYRMAEPVNIAIEAGEQVAIVGPNGAGKSMYVELLTGAKPLLRTEALYDFGPGRSRRASDNIKCIAFRDAYGDSQGPAYYQQRWNQGDDTVWPTAGEALQAAGAGDAGERDALFERLGIHGLLDKPIVQLSSGELRKFQLAKALLTRPRVLIIDNPFIGLDKATRAVLSDLLAALARSVTLVLVVTRREDVPDFITHVVRIDGKSVRPKQTLAEYRAEQPAPPCGLTDAERARILALPAKTDDYHTDSVVAFRSTTIRYGSRTILDRLDWEVRRGEHWALTGENGAGKSTLLSLVCADNPQAYACDIDLFGRRRGTGESIWDIKRHIGYVSPEMFRSYKKNLPAADIVASGLHDTIGLYRRITDAERTACDLWIDLFGLRGLASRPYLTLSSGEQRLVLLARAFVKDPELLILDEPFHGLDMPNRSRARDIIETFCQRPNKTLVMVTHYEEELPASIDHTLHLKKHQ